MSNKLIKRKIVVTMGDLAFTPAEKKAWQQLGRVTWLKSGIQLTPAQFVEHTKEAEVIAFAPEVLGGFENLYDSFVKILPQLPHLQYLILGTTAFGYIPLDIVRQQGIVVTNVPEYSRESVAEHALAMLLLAAKRVLVTDRATQKGEYQLCQGFELAGKTLGVIGLGSIGSRVAELGRAIGMRVIAWDRKPKYLPGIEQVALPVLLKEADAISLNLAENQETHHFLGKAEIAQLKDGVIMVNTADRSLVEEGALARALRSGQVDSYVLEAEDFMSGPLAKAPNMVFLKGFGWYTRECLQRNKELWFENLKQAVIDKPMDVITPLRN